MKLPIPKNLSRHLPKGSYPWSQNTEVDNQLTETLLRLQDSVADHLAQEHGQGAGDLAYNLLTKEFTQIGPQIATLLRQITQGGDEGSKMISLRVPLFWFNELLEATEKEGYSLGHYIRQLLLRAQEHYPNGFVLTALGRSVTLNPGNQNQAIKTTTVSLPSDLLQWIQAYNHRSNSAVVGLAVYCLYMDHGNIEKAAGRFLTYLEPA